MQEWLLRTEAVSYTHLVTARKLRDENSMLKRRDLKPVEDVYKRQALKEYRIPKFRKTNQNMTIDLRPICDKGQRVKKGDILTEGYSTAVSYTHLYKGSENSR